MRGAMSLINDTLKDLEFVYQILHFMVALAMTRLVVVCQA